MLSVAKIKSSATTNPYNLPLKVYVVASMEPSQYTRDGVEKEVQHFMVCDHTGYIKLTSFEKSKAEAIKDETTVIIKNYITKPENIIVTAKTQIFQAPPMTVSQAIITEARSTLRPPTPPTVDIQTIKSSPVKTLQSLAGKIIQDESPRQVMTHGNPTQVRTIVLQDKKDTIKVSLWRKFAAESISVGSFITGKNLLLTEYGKEKQLSTTSRTKIEISTPPEESLAITILGYECCQDGYELLCQLDGDDLATFTCPLDLIGPLLANIELEDEDEDDSTGNSDYPLEKKLLNSLPGICGIRCKDTMITQITTPLEKLP